MPVKATPYSYFSLTPPWSSPSCSFSSCKPIILKPPRYALQSVFPAHSLSLSCRKHLPLPRARVTLLLHDCSDSWQGGEGGGYFFLFSGQLQNAPWQYLIRLENARGGVVWNPHNTARRARQRALPEILLRYVPREPNAAVELHSMSNVGM